MTLSSAPANFKTDKPLYKPYKSNKIHRPKPATINTTQPIRDKSGNLTKNNKNSPNYWSRKILWKA